MRNNRPVVKVNVPSNKKHFEILGLIGTVLSIIGLFLNWHYQQDQNKKWDVLNQPDIEITQMKMNNIREFPAKLISETDFGYQPLAYPGNGDNATLIYHINVYDSLTRRPLGFDQNLLKISDIDSFFKSQKYYRPYHIEIEIDPFFKIENLGKTAADDFRSTIYIRGNKGRSIEWKKIFPNDVPLHLFVGVPFSPIVRVAYDFRALISDTLYFRIETSYSDLNHKYHERDFKIKWLSASNEYSILGDTLFMIPKP